MAVNLRDNSSDTQLALLKEEHPELADFLSVYPEEQINKLIDNKEKLHRIAKKFDKVGTSLATNTVAMTCSDKCPYLNICLLKKEGLNPTGSSCPIEKKIIAEVECDIIESLSIDRNNPIEMDLLWDLIEARILDMRASRELKHGITSQTVVSKSGSTTAERQEPLPQIDLKLELKKFKHSIIDSFVATRRAKKKYGIGDKKTIMQQLFEAANTDAETQ